MRLTPVTKFFTLSANFCVILANVVNLAHYLQSKLIPFFDSDTFRDLGFYKIIVLAVCLAFVFFLVEPEKIKYTSMVGAAVLLVALLYMWFICLGRGFEASAQAKTADLHYFPQLFGSQIYAIECISNLMCVRSTMKNRGRANSVIVSVIALGAVLFTVNGSLLSLSFWAPKSIAFFYFEDNRLMQAFEICFYLTIPTLLVICLIATSNMVEEIPCVRYFLKASVKHDFLSIHKVKVFRLSITTLVLVICLFGSLHWVLDWKRGCRAG